MSKKIKSPADEHYDWSITGDIYMGSALIILKEMLQHFSPLFNLGSDVAKRIKLTSFHPNYEFIIPAIYNFKHGVELSLKMLGIIDYGKYEQVHDLSTLFDVLKRESQNTENEGLIQQLYVATWPTIKKYYQGSYCNTLIHTPDIKNMAERYMASISSVETYIIPPRRKWVTKSFIENTINDIKLIEKEFANAKRQIKSKIPFSYN